jgi:hypothetical protein
MEQDSDIEGQQNYDFLEKIQEENQEETEQSMSISLQEERQPASGANEGFDEHTQYGTYETSNCALVYANNTKDSKEHGSSRSKESRMEGTSETQNPYFHNLQ